MKINDLASQAEIDEHKHIVKIQGGEPLEEFDRATVLKHLEVLEMKKAQFMTGVFIQLEMGQFPESQIPLAQEMSRI